MTEYSPDMHTIEYREINILFKDLKDFIKELQDFEEMELQKHPEAFNFKIDENEGVIILQYCRYKTKEELDILKVRQERRNKIEYQTYLDLKRKFEGN